MFSENTQLQQSQVNGNTYASVDSYDTMPRSLALTAGNGGILFNSMGSTQALNELRLKSGGTISQSTSAAVVAASLGIDSAGTVTLTNTNNDVTDLAATLSSGASLSFVDKNALNIGTVAALGSFGAISGLSDATAASSISLTTVGAITQSSGSLVNLKGSLTLDTHTFDAGNVSVTNSNTAGTVLGNTLIGGIFALDSTGPITQKTGVNPGASGGYTDAYLRVGGNFTTPTGKMTEGSNSDNYFGGTSSVADVANEIRLTGVITLSMSGSNLVGTNGTTTKTVSATSGVLPAVSVVSDAGGKSITSGANASAITLSQGNTIGGTLTITTAGTYDNSGSGVATGVKQTGALTVAGNISIFIQESGLNSTPNYTTGLGALLLLSLIHI